MDVSQNKNMEEVIDIRDCMNKMIERNTTPEDLFGRAIRNLHSAENFCIREHRIALRNNIRVTIACIKLLYDYGQQMSLARMYLMHRIRLFEVREHDLTSEISMLRGVTPTSGNNGTSDGDGSVLRPKEGDPQDHKDGSDIELEIILDTRMIKEIDLSKAAYRTLVTELKIKRMHFWI